MSRIPTLDVEPWHPRIRWLMDLVVDRLIDERSKRSVLLAGLFATIGHLVLLNAVSGSDEGGFALVARFENLPGPNLYGNLFVDRPPLLFAVFDLANTLGRYGDRIVGTVVALIVVFTCARTAFLLAEHVAARWTAWIVAGLTSSPLLLAYQLNGEIIAACLVSISIWAFLEARTLTERRSAWTVPIGMLAGAAGLSALLVKQNFGDAIAFVMAFGFVEIVRTKNLNTQVLAAYIMGALAPATWAILWARDHHGVGALFYAMYGVRFDASGSLTSAHFWRDFPNLLGRIGASIFSGLVPITVAVLVASRRRLGRVTSAAAGYLAAIVIELIGIIGGGTFAPHYYIALIPTLSVAAGVLIARGATDRQHLRRLLAVKVTAILAVASTLVTGPGWAVAVPQVASPAAVTASWLQAAARPTDTVVVPFTNADVITQSGLRPAYPYNWALLTRTRDPLLVLFRQTLTGRNPPTWIVVWDTQGDVGLEAAPAWAWILLKRYQYLGMLCGHQVWLLNGHHSRIPLPKTECG